MLYLPALRLGGPQLANLMSFALGALSSAAIAVFVKRHWGLRSALTAAVLYSSTPMWFSMARSATTDYALSFYYLMEVLCLYRWWEERRLSWVFSAGLFGGFAYGAKFTGGLFAVFLPAILVGGELLAAGRRRAAGSLLFRGLAAFLLACALSISPWLVKNLLFTGNPVYPVLASVFGGPARDAGRTLLLAGDVNAAWAVAGSWRDFLLLPWRLMAGDPNLGFAARTTWFFPVTVLAGLWLGLTRPGWKERTLLILLSSFFLMWAATFWMARYLLPAVGLAAAVVAVTLVREHPGFGKVWLGAVALLTFFNAAVIAADASNRRAFRPALGLESRDNYLRTHLRAYPAIEFINRTLPRDARVLVVGEEKVAYLRRDYIYNTVYDTPVLKEILAAGPLLEHLPSAFGARGVTHLLVNYVEGDRLRRNYGTFAPVLDRTDAFVGFLEHSCNKLFAERGVAVYELP
jgi:4-amino-4-deoxy-L-arabinose transferase-like glycosyltransferase